VFEAILNFLLTSKESQNWGYNASTFWVLGVNAFTIVEWWGLRQQNKKIWKEKSGESLSVTLFSFGLFAFFSFVLYGAAIGSVSSVINGLVLGSMYASTTYGIWLFKKWNVREKVQFWLFAFTTILPMAIFPWYDEMFLIIFSGMIVATATWPWEIWKTGKTGVIEILLLITYLASTIFWAGYALDIEEWVLQIIVLTNLSVLITTTAMWGWYRWKELHSGTTILTSCFCHWKEWKKKRARA